MSAMSDRGRTEANASVSRPPVMVAAASPRSSVSAASKRGLSAPWTLLAGLLAAILYAAFAEGATSPPAESWLQLALLVLAAWVAAAWLYGGRLSLSATAAGWLGLALLTGFAIWTGVTILWSVAPDRSWAELNRAIAYALAVGLGLALGSSLPRAPERVAAGLALVVAPVALYALLGKVLPSVADHAGGVTRLRSPLEYWNALALFCVIGLLPALRLAADPARRLRWRLAALGLVYLLVVVLGLTYSRGGFVALLAGLVVLVALTTERVRTLALFAGAAVLAAIPLAVALTSADLTTNGLPLERRQDDARSVLLAFLVCLALVAAWGRAVVAGERRLAPEAGRRWGRRVAVVAAAILVLGAGAAVASGAVAAGLDRFTDTQRTDRLTDPTRLISTSSGNRWSWWQEAAGAWSDRPVAGWGAGSFPVTHRLYRKEPLSVLQPHSVPLQWLAETGLVGFLLAAGGMIALLAAAGSRVRRLPWAVEDAPPARGYGAALFAVAVAWAVHALYDWDWDIPAVTLPALVALGVLAARPREARAGAMAGRGIVFAGWVALLVLAALSAALPALAETRTVSALDAVGDEDASDGRLLAAAADAEVAAGLNPLAVEPLFALASIAERMGRADEARRHLLRALDRQPENVEAWFRLARVEFARGDPAASRRSVERALELDPLNPGAFALVRRARQAIAPPARSATATGTPLPREVPASDLGTGSGDPSGVVPPAGDASSGGSGAP